MWQVWTIGALSLLGSGGMFFFLRRFLRRSMPQRRCNCPTQDLSGKLAVVTGANSGLGLETAAVLAAANCRVILACRDPLRGEQALAEIRRRTNRGSLVVQQLDLALLDSVYQFCTALLTNEKKVDLLVCNAGVFLNGDHCSLNTAGLERHFAVNHLGHFMLTLRLLPKLLHVDDCEADDTVRLAASNATSRVIIVTSSLAKRGNLRLDDLDWKKRAAAYSDSAAYADSKLANCLFARELHKKYHDRGLWVMAVHTSGMVNSGLLRHHLASLSSLVRPLARFLAWAFLYTPAEGARGLVHCCISDSEAGCVQSGRYYGAASCSSEAEGWPGPARDDILAEALWMESERLCGDDTIAD